MFSPQIERRLVATQGCPVRLERRVAGGTSQSVAVGYGAVFFDSSDSGTEYQIYPGLRERVMPTAFNRCISERQDVRGLYNHDPNFLLGRCSAKTMRLSADKRGLKYEIDLPDTQAGRDVATSIDRGDLSGSSFSFRIVSQKFSISPDGDGDDIREIHDVDVYDTGPVTFPAYEGTTAGMRALGELNAELRSAWEAARGGASRRRPAIARKPTTLRHVRRRLERAERDLAGTPALDRMREQLAALDARDRADDLRRRLGLVEQDLNQRLDRTFPVSPEMAETVRQIRQRIDNDGF